MKEFLDLSPKKIHPPLPEVEITARMPQETLRKIQGVLRNPENYIDKGGAGKVYRLRKGICIKVLDQRHNSPNADKFNLGNTVQEEASFLGQLSNFKVKGVRSPKHLAYLHSRGPEGIDAILMEELKAINLQRVLQGEQQMPKRFEFHPFMSNLEAYLEELHTVEKVAHCDLEARNIMVDEKTGMPYVIDFGRSIHLEKRNESDQKKYIRQDWETLQKVTEQLESYTRVLEHNLTRRE